MPLSYTQVFQILGYFIHLMVYFSMCFSKALCPSISVLIGFPLHLMHIYSGTYYSTRLSQLFFVTFTFGLNVISQ